jgi:Putative polyhydroxyalkanoic acid system protein (PHA_gran_rgn)
MATPITITIPHKLGKTEARARIASGFDQLKSQIAGAQIANFQQAWADDRLTFSAQGLGQTINGRLDVNENDIRIEVDLPAFLAGLADKIAGRLKRQGALLLEKK